VNAEFNVWLLIVGLVLGAGLVWLVIMDSRRRDADIDATELPREAAWLSAVLADEGHDVGPEAAERLLILHRTYLEAPPPDAVENGPVPEGEAPMVRAQGQSAPTRTGAESSVSPDTPTSETPNVAGADTPDTAGAGPTQ
jgi:hypothetical protein